LWHFYVYDTWTSLFLDEISRRIAPVAMNVAVCPSENVHFEELTGAPKAFTGFD